MGSKNVKICWHNIGMVPFLTKRKVKQQKERWRLGYWFVKLLKFGLLWQILKYSMYYVQCTYYLLTFFLCLFSCAYNTFSWQWVLSKFGIFPEKKHRELPSSLQYWLRDYPYITYAKGLGGWGLKLVSLDTNFSGVTNMSFFDDFQYYLCWRRLGGWEKDKHFADIILGWFLPYFLQKRPASIVFSHCLWF